MKLNIKALALTAAIIWSAAILLVGIANIMYPDYGVQFLELISSIYPGYQPFGGVSSVIIGTLYGFVDAGIGGLIFAWLYNCLAK
jgi:hypothetical protein